MTHKLLKFSLSTILAISFLFPVSCFLFPISYAWTNPTAVAPNANNNALYFSNNNIGIGTSNPLYSLTVNGTIYIASSTAGLRFSDGTTQNTAFLGASTQTITAGNVSAGNFGSNTGGGNYTFPASISVGALTAPTAKVDINVGSSGTGLKITADNAGPWALAIKNNSATGTGLKIFQANDGTVQFYNNYNAGPVGAFITLNQSDGNVGIGTTSPQAPLNVVGNALFGGTSAGTIGSVQITTGGASPISNRLTYGTDGTGWKFAIGKNQNGTVTEQLTIQDNGNVGIGTTLPATKFSINDGTSANIAEKGFFIRNDSTYDYMNIWNYGTNVYAIESADETTYRNLSLQPHGGNVGIGTTSPSAKLQVANGNIIVGGAGGGTNYGLLFTPKDGDSWSWEAAVGGSGGLQFGVGTTIGTSPLMTILNTGNVGIGTTSPGDRLTVVPSGTGSWGFTIKDSANIDTIATIGSWSSDNAGLSLNIADGTRKILLLASGNSYFNGGNVGIATTTPAYSLTVAGTIYSSTGGYKFPDGTTQTTAFLGGSSQTVTAANVSSGAFGSNTGGGNYTFPANVGIGTTSPGSMLHVENSAAGVASEVRIFKSVGTDASHASLKIGYDSVNNLEIYRARNAADIYFTSSQSGANQQFTTSGTGNFIFNNGNVGIGTTSPGTKLHISSLGTSGQDTEAFRLGYTNALNTQGHISMFAGDNVTETQRITYGLGAATTNGYMAFSTYNNGLSEAIRILGSGNVGIATTTPAYPLTVAGTIYSSTGGYKFPDGTTQTTAASASGQTTSAGNVSSGAFGSNTGGGNYTFPASVYFAGTGANFLSAGTGDGASYGTYNFALNGWYGMALKDYSGAVHGVYNFRTGDLTTDGVAYFKGTGNNSFTGNVGIGTTAPQGVLDLGAGTNGRSIVWGGLGGANHYASIGTSYASASLSTLSFLKPNTSVDNYLVSYSGTYPHSGVRFDAGNGSISYFTETATNRSIGSVFDYAAATKLYIRSDGNVGIGTTSPGQKLSVAGAIESTTGGFKFPDGTVQTTAYSDFINSSENYILKSAGMDQIVNSSIYDNGNVGIATTTPAYRLSVAGTIFSSTGGFRFPDGTTQTTAASASGQITSAANVSAGDFGYNVGGGNYSFPGFVGIGTINPRSRLSVGGDGISGAGAYTTGGTYGVYTTGNTYGVYATGNTSYGVYATGSAGAIYASSTAGAIYATNSSINNNTIYSTGGQYAVVGTVNNSTGAGVYGSNTGDTYGVYGLVNNSSGAGVNGANSGSGAGVYGSSQAGNGVEGIGSTGVRGSGGSTGVYGTGSNYGVYGSSQTQGIYGTSNYMGIRGVATDNGNVNYAGYFVNDDTGGDYAAHYGIYGSTASQINSNGTGIGVYGQANGASAYGVYGESDRVGVYGVAVKGVVGNGSSYDFDATGAGVNYGSTSSGRWKKNVVQINNVLEKIKNIDGVYFDWDKEHGGQHDLGFIGESVGKEFPEIVVWDEKAPGYVDGMDYSKMTPILLQAIKEQQKQIEDLKSRIQKLENK